MNEGNDIQFISNTLLDLLHFESLSSSESGIIEYITHLLDLWDLNYKLQPLGNGSYNIIINNNKSPYLTIATHVDTISIKAYPRIKVNGIIAGTGSVDAKGSLASILYALKVNSDLPDYISIVLFSDEEKGGSGSSIYLSHYKPKFGLILEPTELKICDRGYGSIEGYIIITARDYHPSVVDFEQKNTIYLTYTVLNQLKNELDTLKARFTPYCIQCGSEYEYSTPRECKVCFDIGIPPMVDPRDIIKILYKTKELQAEFMIREYSRPFILEDAKYRCLLERAYNKVFGTVEWKSMPSWTDANNFALFGVPVAVFGPGTLFKAHSKFEEINLKDILLAGRYILEIISELSKEIPSNQ